MAQKAEHVRSVVARSAPQNGKSPIKRSMLQKKMYFGTLFFIWGDMLRNMEIQNDRMNGYTSEYKSF